MQEPYDSYDYPSYWITRKYEHLSETVALKDLLAKISKINTIIDIGAGFGRLTPVYIHRAKKIILSDPSSSLINIARAQYRDNKIVFIKSNLEGLPEKLKSKRCDVVVMIRVMHHMDNPKKAFKSVNKILKRKGYLILEFANKRHIKATASEFLKGNVTFSLDIQPKEVAKKPNSNRKLPFLNHHPDVIKYELTQAGFNILETRSVSNIRSPFIKRLLSTDTLVFLERYLQKPFARFCFGPSIFILAQKRN